MTQRDNESRSSGAKGRAADASKQDERPPLDVWSPANVLETPPDTNGYRHRWIAEYVNGQHTPRNVQLAIREKYERVRREDLPEDFIVDEDTKGDGYARTGGLILMKVPLEYARLREQYYLKRTHEAATAADVLQGVAGKDAVSEDRGSRSLEGREAGAALAKMSSN